MSKPKIKRVAKLMYAFKTRNPKTTQAQLIERGETAGLNNHDARNAVTIAWADWEWNNQGS